MMPVKRLKHAKIYTKVQKKELFQVIINKLQKQQTFHRDWVVNSKSLLKNSKSGLAKGNSTSKEGGFFLNQNEDTTSSSQAIQFSSMLKEKLKQKDKEYGSKLMNSIFSKNKRSSQ